MCLPAPSAYDKNKWPNGHIEAVWKIEYLGLILNSILSCTGHIESVKLKPVVGIMYKTRDLLPKQIRSVIYISMIPCALTYMIELWGATANWNLLFLQRMQNKIVRNICSACFHTPRVELYSDSGLRLLSIRGLLSMRQQLARLYWKIW